MNQTFAKHSKRHPSFIKFLMNWGWPLLFILLCWTLYAKGIQEKKEIFAGLSQKINHLEIERGAAFAKQEDLLLQIESQKDPAWIEMLMMKKLGVVPEGQVKVYFERE